MARHGKSGTKRPKADAPVAAPRPARGATAPAIEDTMFFPRLRRHARWMFVFLALVFAVGFVAFGVGAGGTGIGDLFRGRGGSSGAPSLSSARSATEKRPNDAQAWRDYSTALQTDGRTDEAIRALRRYVALKPRDADGLRELAALYLAQAAEKQSAAQRLQFQAVYSGAAQSYPGLVASDGRPIIEDRIGAALNAQASTAINEAVGEARTAYADAVSTYRRISALQPNDPNVQLELAQAAQQAGDARTAIDAYEKFLELAPDDPSAAIVKQQLAQLRQQAAGGAASGSGG